MRVEYHQALERELVEIRDYYNDRSPGLGDEFVDAFEQQVLRIRSMPERWMIVQGDIRRALMKRFPYVVLFRKAGDDVLRVIVVKHESRHPAHGLQRE